MTNLMRRTENDWWRSTWSELTDLRKQMDRFFDGGSLATADWVPSVETSETDSEYRIRAALPDVRKEDVRVTVEDGLLCIRGERRARKEERNEKFHRLELQEGAFSRSFTMPSDADADRVSAKYENGMLELAIGRSTAAKVSGRAIAVK
jgi:HSP20 family protein